MPCVHNIGVNTSSKVQRRSCYPSFHASRWLSGCLRVGEKHLLPTCWVERTRLLMCAVHAFLFHDRCPTALHFCPFLPSLTASAATLRPCNWFHASSAGCSLFSVLNTMYTSNVPSIYCKNFLCVPTKEPLKRTCPHHVLSFLRCFWKSFNFTVLTPIIPHCFYKVPNSTSSVPSGSVAVAVVVGRQSKLSKEPWASGQQEKEVKWVE